MKKVFYTFCTQRNKKIFWGILWIALFSVLLNAQTPIEIINPSFELPGTGKIKGWDGPGSCSDPAWTGSTDDIPGWTSDEPVWDSGVETGWGPTDGEYTAFLMGNDTSVYQITDYVIQEGDQIELVVDAKNNWNAMVLEMILFYEKNGNRMPVAIEDFELTSTMTEYSLTFSTNEHPESIGHKLGIEFDNVGDSASWVGMDNVRLLNYKTGVSEKQKIVKEFYLAQNYPNPFNPQTEIHYQLPGSGIVQLAIYDLLGKKVRTLVDWETQSCGLHRICWNGMDDSGKEVPGGVYFYRIQARISGQVFTEIKKMVLVR